MHQLFAFAGVIALASCSPGPNVIAVITSALARGLTGASLAILGNLTALFVIASAAALGVGGLLHAFPDAYLVMKLAGAAYLIWMGVRAFRSSFASSPPSTETASAPCGGWRLLCSSFLISMSNPKSILFLSAAFPAFLDPDSPLVPQFGLMFATIILVVCIVHSAYAALAMRLRSHFVSDRGRRWTQRISGISFGGLGIGLFADAVRSR